MERIYVIEDDENIQNLLKVSLESFGYEAECFDTAEEGLKRIEEAPPSLVIFDWMLPGMDGISAIRKLRRTEIGSRLPIMLLTAKEREMDKVTGLDCGADDYMVKPFVAQEFVWRITAILRRAYKETEETSFLLNACKVDLEQAQVYKESSEPIALTAKEVEILKKLYANAGRIVTLGALCQTVCGDIYIGYEKTLMSHIRHIREKIEEKPSSPVSLLTVKGIGYKLVLRGK